MGSSYRQNHFCALEDDDEEEPIPNTLCGIVAVFIAFLYQAQHQKESMKAIYSNITDLKESVNARLEDIEKALTRLALSCGSSISLEEGTEEGNGEDATEELIKKHIRKYDADKTGMIDWALESLGGSIVGVKETESYILGGTSVLGIPCSKFSSDPSSVIRPSTMPGDCWAFKGEGTIIIKLVTYVYITNFTLEHIPKEMTPEGEIYSAPRIFIVHGITDESNSGSKHTFGHFEYKSTGDPLQSFPIQNPSYNSFDMVEFNFKSNHGNNDFTCVYRIRIHGKLTMGCSLP